MSQEKVDQTNPDGGYPCTGCSQCCRDVSWSPLPTKPGSKECLNLTDDGRCSIYHLRPDICIIDKVYEDPDRQLYKHLSMEDWYRIQAMHCNQKIRGSKMDDSYLVVIGG